MPRSENLVVGYAYEDDAADPRVQSGHPHAILRELEARVRVHRAFPLNKALAKVAVPKQLAHRALGRNYRSDREPRLLKSLSAQVEKHLVGSSAGVVFAPGSIVISYMSGNIPSVYCADATFASMLEFYDSFSRCAPGYVSRGHEQESRALQRATAIVFPSCWAAEGAVQHYGADPRKIHVVPFGANLSEASDHEVEAAIAERTCQAPRLVFVGRDWNRKGGDLVTATCRLLAARGFPVQLDIIGPPKPPAELPLGARFHGAIDLRSSKARSAYTSLLLRAHLLFVPSRAEAFGMTFCEAAAHGLPVVSCAVGGIPSVVQHEVTGTLLSRNAQPQDFGEAIVALLASADSYRAACAAARARYRDLLNWEAFGNRLVEILRSAAKGQPPSHPPSPNRADTMGSRGTADEPAKTTGQPAPQPQVAPEVRT